jgi:hypothetical protein
MYKSALLGATALSLTLGFASAPALGSGVNGGVRHTTGSSHVVAPKGGKAVVLDAVVNSDGSLARGQGATGSLSLSPGSGDYEVDFNRDVTGCAYVATLGNATAGTAPNGFITDAARSGNPDAVFVKTSNTAGSPADIQFHLMIGCPKL